MFGYKLIKSDEHKRLLDENKILQLRESVFISRVKNLKLSSFEELTELKNIILVEFQDVEKRLKIINSIYSNLKNNNHGK